MFISVTEEGSTPFCVTTVATDCIYRQLEILSRSI